MNVIYFPIEIENQTLYREIVIDGELLDLPTKSPPLGTIKVQPVNLIQNQTLTDGSTQSTMIEKTPAPQLFQKNQYHIPIRNQTLEKGTDKLVVISPKPTSPVISFNGSAKGEQSLVNVKTKFRVQSLVNEKTKEPREHHILPETVR